MGDVVKFNPQRSRRGEVSAAKKMVAPTYGENEDKVSAARRSDADELVEGALRKRVRRARWGLGFWAGVFLVVGWWPLSLWFLGCALFARRIIERRWHAR